MTDEERKINELEQQTRALKDIKKSIVHVTQWLAAIFLILALFGIERMTIYMKLSAM